MRLLGWGGSCKGTGEGRKRGGMGRLYIFFWFKCGGKMCCERSLTVGI